MHTKVAPNMDVAIDFIARDCDGDAEISEDERRAVDEVADSVFNAVKKALNIPLVGSVLRPKIKEGIVMFAQKMAKKGLNGKHIGIITRTVLSRLHEHLVADKK